MLWLLLHALLFASIAFATFALRKEWPRILAALRREEIPPRR